MKIDLPDTQNNTDQRNLPINQVGIKSYRHPIVYQDLKFKQQSIATFDMYVDLPSTQRGTHMSRFIELLNQYEHVPIDYQQSINLCQAVQHKLKAESAKIAIQFPFFLKKQAPVSKIQSLMDYQAIYQISIDQNKQINFIITLIIPVTSLCPCSKSISKYGAHNQRSEVILTLTIDHQIDVAQIIQSIEKNASCELYGVLKREDEKHVTEKAYDHPQFVEDMVRNFAIILEKQKHLKHFRVSTENFESIHNHSAYAMISKKQAS